VGDTTEIVVESGAPYQDEPGNLRVATHKCGPTTVEFLWGPDHEDGQPVHVGPVELDWTKDEKGSYAEVLNMVM